MKKGYSIGMNVEIFQELKNDGRFILFQKSGNRQCVSFGMKFDSKYKLRKNPVLWLTTPYCKTVKGALSVQYPRYDSFRLFSMARPQYSFQDFFAQIHHDELLDLVLLNMSIFANQLRLTSIDDCDEYLNFIFP